MFFAITALGVSAAQIAIGIAIGLALRKSRQRLRRAGENAFAPGERPSPIEALWAAEIKPAVSVDPKTIGQLATSDDSGGKCAISKENSATPAAPEILPPSGNRRKSPRRDFDFRQRVAPYHGGALPGKASFREVECHDISATGFSFLSSQLPDFDAVVVALGAPPRPIYVWARIVNRFQIEHGPAPLYRIGCRFVGQMDA